MKTSKWWYRGFRAFFETANLVALAILCLASFLTIDSNLFYAGILLEAIYLALRSGSTRYGEQLAQQGERSEEFYLDQALLVVTVTGFVVIMFFGFGKHLLTHRFPDLTHAEGWEAGAIAWTGLFLFYYLVKFRATGEVFFDKLIALFLTCVGGYLVWQAGTSIGKWSDHLPFVTAIGLIFLLVDGLSMFFHIDPKERMLSRNSLWWADVPMVFAFGVLWGYLLMHRDTETPDVFVSGVISCQLLISNAAFVVMEFELLRPPDGASTEERGTGS